MDKLSFSAIRELVCSAICTKEGTGFSCYIIDLCIDAVVYESAGTDGVQKSYQRSYTILDGVVTLGDATEVQRQVEYVPVKAACQIMAATAGDTTGSKWNVRVVRFGTDNNNNYWDQATLTAAVDKFEAAKVFMLTEAQHQAKQHPFGKPCGDLVGVLQGAVAKADGIYATLVLLPTATWLRENLVGCRDMGLPDLLGLSVDVVGKAGLKNKQKTLTSIQSVTVDVVYDPAAGGEFLKMSAATQTHTSQEETPMLKTMLAALTTRNQPEAARIQAALDSKSISDDQAVEQIFAAVGATGRSPLQDQTEAAGAKTLQQMQLLACSMNLRETLAVSKLPEPVQDKLRASFTGVVFVDESLQAAIKAEKEMLDKLTASGTVVNGGDVRITEDRRDKVNTMLDDFFAGKVQSFKACYQDITGDIRVSGDMRDASRLSAAISTTQFDQLLGDSITRKMVVEYNSAGLSDWKKVAQSGPVFDFRTQRRVRIGGYGDLPAVAQSAAYAALTTPADEEAIYTPGKKGGTESITLESIRNDDVMGIRRVPQKLGRAAARTLYKFVFDMIGANGVIYDAAALAVAGHNNIGTTALAKATLQAGRLAMLKQTELGSAEPLGIAPKFILVPVDLADTAFELTVQPNMAGFVPTAADSIKSQIWDVIPVKTWTDVNNWWLVADPADIPTIEVGFLDGKEEPELFVQDAPNVGSLFSNDQITYKIRHIYGGAVLDFRGFYGAIVP